MNNPHVLVIPYPAQGHVRPLLEFSLLLVKHGIKITFVNTEFSHQRIMNAFGSKVSVDGSIHFVSLPDGMGVDENKNHIGRSIESICQFMPMELKQLINEINRPNGDEVTCILTDMFMGWSLEIAAELGIKAAALFPASALSLASMFAIPTMIDGGVIDENGTPLKREMIQLSSETPAINPSHFSWVSIEGFTTQKILFNFFQRNIKAVEKIEWLLSNSTYELEAGALATMAPKVLPIGPLSTYEGVGTLVANFWPEDSSCLKWLDKQPPRSVIYVAFGSFTILDQTQFWELALGLQHSNKPFLWVVRPDITEAKDEAYPKGFRASVADRGQMVGWAPQRAVLSHPSIACFLSHCGWNSTLEGVSNGVPFLCWPYFADQFMNESYICEIWKVGLKLEKDESGIIRQEEIKSKMEKLLSDENLKARAMELKEKIRTSVKEGGYSNKILKSFIEWVKS
ncbi:hypothetical protein SLE2022_277390 [Rubroshorea leprosula]